MPSLQALLAYKIFSLATFSWFTVPKTKTWTGFVSVFGIGNCACPAFRDLTWNLVCQRIILQFGLSLRSHLSSLSSLISCCRLSVPSYICAVDSKSNDSWTWFANDSRVPYIDSDFEIYVIVYVVVIISLGELMKWMWLFEWFTNWWK